MMKTAYDIVIRPIITEQSMEDLDIKKYAFEVAKDANKVEIKKAIEEIFGVTVIKVTTLNVRGKEKRTGAYPNFLPKKNYCRLSSGLWGIAIVR